MPHEIKFDCFANERIAEFFKEASQWCIVVNRSDT